MVHIECKEAGVGECVVAGSMLADNMRARALKWLTTEFNSNYKGRVVAKAAAAAAAGAADNTGVRQRHLKRRKVSAAAFFADSSDSSSDGEADGDAATGTRAVDELAAYLEVPQIKYTTEEDMMAW